MKLVFWKNNFRVKFCAKVYHFCENFQIVSISSKKHVFQNFHFPTFLSVCQLADNILICETFAGKKCKRFSKLQFICVFVIFRSFFWTGQVGELIIIIFVKIGKTFNFILLRFLPSTYHFKIKFLKLDHFLKWNIWPSSK